MHQQLGACDARIFVTDTFRAMGARDGWHEEGARLADRVELDRSRDALPLIVHSFSNAGFWTLRAMLDVASRGVRESLAGVVLDSAPGFPADHVSARFTAEFAAMAMMPGLLASLRLAPALRHPLLTPAAQAFMGLWHLVSPAQVRFMASSQHALREHVRRVPVLLAYGGADELVLPRYVEAFADALAHDGADVMRAHWPDAPHVRAMLTHRREYTAHVRSLVMRALATSAPAAERASAR
jgi:hypothetical protein